MELATLENTLLALEPIKRIVPTTMTRITANITAYSAISCPCSSLQSLSKRSIDIRLLSGQSMFSFVTATGEPRERNTLRYPTQRNAHPTDVIIPCIWGKNDKFLQFLEQSVVTGKVSEAMRGDPLLLSFRM